MTKRKITRQLCGITAFQRRHCWQENEPHFTPRFLFFLSASDGGKGTTRNMYMNIERTFAAGNKQVAPIWAPVLKHETETHAKRYMNQSVRTEKYKNKRTDFRSMTQSPTVIVFSYFFIY